MCVRVLSNIAYLTQNCASEKEIGKSRRRENRNTIDKATHAHTRTHARARTNEKKRVTRESNRAAWMTFWPWNFRWFQFEAYLSAARAPSLRNSETKQLQMPISNISNGAHHLSQKSLFAINAAFILIAYAKTCENKLFIPCLRLKRNLFLGPHVGAGPTTFIDHSLHLQIELVYRACAGICYRCHRNTCEKCSRSQCSIEHWASRIWSKKKRSINIQWSSKMPGNWTNRDSMQKETTLINYILCVCVCAREN